MPVDESLKTEIDSAIAEAVEVVDENAASALAEAEGQAEGQAEGEAEAEGEVDDQAAAAEEAEATESKAAEESGGNILVGDDPEGDGAVVGDDPEGDGAVVGAPVKPAISDYALIQASRVGIDPDAARQFPDEQSLLRAVINIIDGTQGTDEAAEQEEDPFAEFPEMDPEVFEPEAIKVFNAMKGVLVRQNETIKEMQSQHEQVATNSQQASANEVERWFDAQVEGLGADFADALGAGGYASLDRGSSQFAKRDAIASQMAILLAGYQATGAQAPPREQVFDSAAKLVLHDEFGGLKEKKLASSLSRRSRQHIARANGQTSKSSESPRDSVANIIDKKFFPKGTGA